MKQANKFIYEKALAEKKKNPFANETYSYDFENGSRHDSYEIKFLSQNECSVTVTSIDSKGEEKLFLQMEIILMVTKFFLLVFICLIRKLNTFKRFNGKDKYVSKTNTKPFSL